MDIDFLRNILKNEEPYYQEVTGTDNPYRDGYITEPPKKPRASYLFFQATMRDYFAHKNPGAVQSELMGMLGETWRSLDEEDKVPFQTLANEEQKEFERHKTLLDKAQKPAGVWQPIRRCLQVLDRLASDSFAEIFLEPVDLEDFPDYTEIVDQMMDLGTVRQRLENKKYQAPEQFARDMRRVRVFTSLLMTCTSPFPPQVWNNCKIYNQHGSAIWHVADYMSKQFERLYHAWVLDFRERYLRWADPKARPWEHSCRIHDGKCGTPDDKMVLCDHCDSMYGLSCVNLKKVPSRAWHCPECKPKLKSTKGARMLSATAEHAARKRAELGDLPKKKINRTMFLVKWKGLGYEFCTWETKEDVGNDSLIADYHRREKGYSDEADMPGEILDKHLSGVLHVNEKNAGGNGVFPVLRTQLYAQSRGVHFLKFGMDVPDKLGWEIGSKTSATGRFEKHLLPEDAQDKSPHSRAVVECLQDIITRVQRGQRAKSLRSHTLMTPPLTGEYDAIIPITAKGLMMNVGEIHGSVAFLGYRQFPDRSRGPAEIAQIVRNVGDKIIAVDGVSTYGKSFKEVIDLLKETGKNSYAYMRFLENRFGMTNGSLASIGAIGRYAVEELHEKFANDRRKLVIQRKNDLLDKEPIKAEESDDEVSSKQSESDADSEIGSEGSFEPDSEDEEMADTFNAKDGSPITKEQTKPPMHMQQSPEGDEAKERSLVEEAPANEENGDVAMTEEEALPEKPDELLVREENTRSLGMRLLDADLGYSSDEGGEEDWAFFLDGVDSTFARAAEYEPPPSSPKKKSASKDEKKKKPEAIIPASKTQFAALGERAKLVVASALSTNPPSVDTFATYPEVPETAPVEAAPKTTKRSTVKIEQVNPSNGESLHVWPNVEAVAATLQLPLNSLRSLLKGEYDEETGEEVGGFKWRYALAGAKVTAGLDTTSRGGGGKKAKEAWLEFRDKLYDPSEPHTYKNSNRLRDYQVDGVNWLASTWYKRQGCILADGTCENCFCSVL